MKGYTYYAHESKTDCSHFTRIRCEILENAVIPHVFGLIGDAPAMERAAKNAVPSREARAKLDARIKDNKKSILKLEGKIDKIQTA